MPADACRPACVGHHAGELMHSVRRKSHEPKLAIITTECGQSCARLLMAASAAQPAAEQADLQLLQVTTAAASRHSSPPTPVTSSGRIQRMWPCGRGGPRSAVGRCTAWLERGKEPKGCCPYPSTVMAVPWCSTFETLPCQSQWHPLGEDVHAS